MPLVEGFKKWLIEDKRQQRGKWKITVIFLLIPIIGEIFLIKQLRRPDVEIVPEIGINKALFFVQAVIFKYLLWFIVALIFVPGFAVKFVNFLMLK